MKTKPTWQIRIGAIRAMIWQNNTEAGVRYNTSFSRLYKDGNK